ncbi:unnamed protein product [Porites evermanni]|uniref:Uncharacterized protein n=1 Tax=Porites evermanni TaxID=104178 RepID=A0ABN8LI76_9CNID|nr:unnamed protein product [Porites evermanni]
MNSIPSYPFVVLVLSLTLLQKCVSRPPTRRPLCMDGKFYEENVFTYLSCSEVMKHSSHYKNYAKCCATTNPTSAHFSKTAQLSSGPSSHLSESVKVEGRFFLQSEGFWKEDILIAMTFLLSFLSVSVSVWTLVLRSKNHQGDKAKFDSKLRWLFGGDEELCLGRHRNTN